MCACARVRVRARARARARSLMATLPGGGPAEDGSELRSHACGVAKVEARGHAPGVGRIVIVTVTPREDTPVTAGGEHRRARRCSPSGGGGRKCRQLAPRHVMRPRSRATPSPPRPWRSRDATDAHTRGALQLHDVASGGAEDRLGRAKRLDVIVSSR